LRYFYILRISDSLVDENKIMRLLYFGCQHDFGPRIWQHYLGR
jgi:hypothetical protein